MNSILDHLSIKQHTLNGYQAVDPDVLDLQSSCHCYYVLECLRYSLGWYTLSFISVCFVLLLVLALSI